MQHFGYAETWLHRMHYFLLQIRTFKSLASLFMLLKRSLWLVKSLYRESDIYVSHHPTSKHQCTRFSSVPNLNSQANSPISVAWKPPYHIRKQKTDVISLNQPRGMLAKMPANGIQIHARTNQRHYALASRSRQSLNAGRL